MIEHRSVLCLWQALEHACYRGHAYQRVALNASLNFDASVQQLVQLLSGRTVVLVPQEVRLDAEAFIQFIQAHRIEGVDCTPSQLRAWMAAGLAKATGPLQLSLVGGESIDSQLWDALSASHIRFVNVYGPTECTVDATLAPLQGDATAPHIGRPMQNRRVYVLDGHREPVPIGVCGEIYIGGAGVARGYLNRPALTNERFVVDPFSAEPDARMYKTGDIGRWRADGTIEYLGRNDHQVKIRGFRIELGEIEAQLLKHRDVKEAVVVAQAQAAGQQRLVAYVVPAHEQAGGALLEVWRTHLKAVLPEYMVPSAFVPLERLPRTPSGKLDRRALPAPEVGAYSRQTYEAPVVAGIWQELLRVERVGRHDNFFELGGHSVLAMQFVARVRSALSVKLPIGTLFECPDLQGLSREIERLRQPLLGPVESDVDDLLAHVSSMTDEQVEDLLATLRTVARL
jgi:acyl-coenzyme A synthetase/AMP-(fatty) acid ligase